MEEGEWERESGEKRERVRASGWMYALWSIPRTGKLFGRIMGGERKEGKRVGERGIERETFQTVSRKKKTSSRRKHLVLQTFPNSKDTCPYIRTDKCTNRSSPLPPSPLWVQIVLFLSLLPEGRWKVVFSGLKVGRGRERERGG